MVLANRNIQLNRANIRDADWPFAEKDGMQIPLTFDAVVANLYYSQNWDIKNIDREKDIRFKNYGSTSIKSRLCLCAPWTLPFK